MRGECDTLAFLSLLSFAASSQAQFKCPFLESHYQSCPPPTLPQRATVTLPDPSVPLYFSPLSLKLTLLLLCLART